MFILIPLLFLSFTHNRDGGDDIIVRWHAKENKIIIEIYKFGGKYYGKAIKARKDETLNKTILQDFVYSVSVKWNGGG